MSKKTKKSEIIIDGVEYKIIQWTNQTETNLKYVPQNPLGVIGSGLHIPEKNRQRIHFDTYDGKEHLKGQENYVGNDFKFPPIAIINFKEHLVFPVPPDNQIAVLNGRDKPMEFISLEYYKKNKEKYISKYFIRLGDEENPQVLKLK